MAKTKRKAIATLIKDLDMDIQYKQNLIRDLSREPNNFIEKVLVKYIEERSTVRTAEFVKSMGIRSPKDTVFSGGDVTDIIKGNYSEDVSIFLWDFANQIFDKNDAAIIKQFG